ncbi:helix-turn-helix domain-containing protein [Bacillus sp. FJAT-27445]|uniref:helix-turn-helix domain-containing protein n=1 Tax=Bacillus sp. FJAT-27445 TaxID=1679166 RepID=UPI0007436646|nr:helix-turn-helix domain-containing protein [Bacillus sp. FJAT-27445]
MRKVGGKPIIQYFDIIILYCLKKLKGERTIYSIYHLLKGKKSAQTIQDAHLFSLTVLFMALGSVTREMIEGAVLTLKRQSLIQEGESQRFFLTAKGEEYLEVELLTHPLPLHLQGWKYHLAGQYVWERLSLLAQVCSHISRKESRYIPIQKKRRTQNWIKNFLGKLPPEQRVTLPRVLFHELSSLLEGEKEIKPDILVLRLTGYQSAGLTSRQAAMMLGMDEFHYHLEFLGILHYICKKAAEQEEKYPLLFRLLEDEGSGSSMTLTSRQTLKLLNQGVPIDSIAAVRGLKRSTIEDHIVEIALNVSGFSIDPYVSAEEQEKIIELATKSSTRQLRELKELTGGISYFKIRLVLAKLGDG